MPLPAPLSAPKQLLVEGRTAQNFFDALIRNLGLGGFQLQNYGGITELRPFLQGLRRKRGFSRQTTSLAVVRDAETNAANAWASVTNTLGSVGLTVPSEPGVLAQGRPPVAVFILPDGTQPGMLEDLCWQAVGNDPAVSCVEEFIDCLQCQGGGLPSNLAKARIQAFLSSRPRPGLLLGEAALRSVLPWDNPAFDTLKSFLQSL